MSQQQHEVLSQHSMHFQTDEATPTNSPQTNDAEEESQYSIQNRSKFNAVKVTPILGTKKYKFHTSFSKPTHLNFHHQKRPLEAFSALCFSLGCDKALEVVFNKEETELNEIADSVLSFDEAMKKAIDAVKELNHLSEQLIRKPGIHPETVKCVDWVSKVQKDMNEGSTKWISLRNEVETKILKEVVETKSNPKSSNK